MEQVISEASLEEWKQVPGQEGREGGACQVGCFPLTCVTMRRPPHAVATVGWSVGSGAQGGGDVGWQELKPEEEPAPRVSQVTGQQRRAYDRTV